MSLRHYASTGWVAIFNGTDTSTGRFAHVDDWDPVTGAALVVDPELGIRRAVGDYPDFSHLERADRIVAALPGAGWRVRCLDQNADDDASEEVIAWLVMSHGALTPVTVDSNGQFGPAEDAEWCYAPHHLDTATFRTVPRVSAKRAESHCGND